MPTAKKTTNTKTTTKKTTVKPVQKKEEPKVLNLFNHRGVPVKKREINPESGNRFKKDSNADVALRIILRMVKSKKSLKQIREALNAYTRKNGKDRNLDAGYISYIVTSHPDYIKVWSTHIEILKTFPKPVKPKAK